MYLCTFRFIYANLRLHIYCVSCFLFTWATVILTDPYGICQMSAPLNTVKAGKAESGNVKCSGFVLIPFLWSNHQVK